MAQDKRQQALEALTQVALQLNDGNATDAFTLLHEAAWAAEERGKRGKKREPRGSPPVALLPREVLQAPPGLGGAAPRGSDEGGSTSSFTEVPEGEAKEGEEEISQPATCFPTTLSDPKDSKISFTVPSVLAGTAAFAGTGGEGGVQAQAAAEGAGEDSQEEEAALSQEEEPEAEAQQQGHSPPRTPPPLSHSCPQRGEEEEEESDSSDGFSNPLFEEEGWTKVQRRRSPRSGGKGADGQAGKTSSAARTAANDKRSGDKKMGGKDLQPGLRAPGRGGVPQLHLPPGAHHRGVPPLPSLRKGEGLLATGEPGGPDLLGSRTYDPAHTLGHVSGAGRWECQEGQGRPRLASIVRVYIPDTAEAWQSVADAARDSHYEDTAKYRGNGYIHPEWDEAENDLFHVISRRNEALLSLPQLCDFQILQDYIDTVRSPSIVVGGDSFGKFWLDNQKQEVWLREKDHKGPYLRGDELISCPRFLVPAEDFKGASAIIRDSKEVPLQVVEIRGLRSIGRDDGKRVYAAYEGRRAFLFRTGEFSQQLIRNGAFLRVFVHHEKWTETCRWLELGGQGGIRLHPTHLYTISGDGEEPEGRLPSHPRFDARKGLKGRGVRTYGGCLDWGTIGYPRGEEEYFPLIAAAGVPVSSGSTSHNSLLRGLQQRLLDPFTGKVRSRAPRIRHVAAPGGLRPELQANGGLLFSAQPRRSRGGGGVEADKNRPQGSASSARRTVKAVKDAFGLDDFGRPAKLSFAQATKSPSAQRSTGARSKVAPIVVPAQAKPKAKRRNKEGQ